MEIVLTTFPSEDAAAEAVRQLVTEGLAACGTLIRGARSIYMWEGNLEDTAETLVLFKTANGPALTVRLGEIHPYDTPEIVSFAPGAVSPRYAAWVEAMSSAKASR